MTDAKTPVPKPAKSAGEQPKTKRRRRWGRRAGIGLVVCAVVYILFGFFGVPLLIQKVGVPRLDARLRGAVALDRAAFNPFTLALTLEGLAIDDDAGERLAGFERFDGDFQLVASIFRPGFRFRRAVVTGPEGFIAIDDAGRINLIDQLEDTPTTSAGEPLRRIPRIVITELAALDASATFRDERLDEVFEKRIEHLNFTIDGLDTDPEHENNHRIVAALADGAAVEWTGAFYLNPLTATGSLTLTGLDLPSFMPYASQFTSLRIDEGRLSVEVGYDLAPVREQDRASVAVQRVLLEDIVVNESGERVLGAPLVEVTGVEIDADARRLAVGAVRIENSDASIVREAGGALRIARFEREARERREAAALDRSQRVDVRSIEYPLVQLETAIRHLVEDVTLDWTIDVGAIEIDGAAATFADRSTPDPVRIELSAISLEAGPIRSGEDFRTPFTGTARLDGSAPLAATGQIRPLEFGAEVQVEASDIALATFAPYLPRELPEPFPAPRLTGGAAGASGAATLSMRDGEPITLTWRGEAGVTALEARDQAGERTLLEAEALALDGEARATLAADGPALQWEGAATARGARLDADLGQSLAGAVGDATVRGALALDAETLTFDGDVDAAGLVVDVPEQDGLHGEAASARLSGIAFDQGAGSLAVGSVAVQAPAVRRRMDLVRTGAPASGSAPEVETEIALPALPLALRIDTLALRDGRIELIDTAGAEDLSIIVESADLDLANIASDGQTIATIALSAAVQGSGALRVNGEVDAFRAPPYADVVVEMDALPTRPYSPLVEPRLGWSIDRGRLTLRLPVRAEDGRVDGRLGVTLSEFYLGERVEAPDAPDLPLKLGINLLRNRNNEIPVDVPFSGDMTDPKFTLGGVIWEAFFGILGRAATAPFQLLANAFAPGKDVDLSQAPFAPGADSLTPDTLSTVDTLGRALVERPALTLTATGVFDPVADGDALRRAALDASLLTRAQAADPGVMGLDDASYLVQLEALFAERFPDRAPIRVPVPPGARDQIDVAPEEMEAALLGSIDIAEAQLADLARRRAEAAARAMIADAGVESARITIGDPRPATDDESPRVVFDLGGG
ncbi:MAG: DUF748 domain-containing protein [Phycisphaerales bacterium]